MTSTPLELVATCALGTEPAVMQELRALHMRHVKGQRGSVRFHGNLEDGMRACLELRSAMRVLWQLAAFPAPNADALYQGAHAIPWADHVSPRHTIAVSASGGNEELRHSGFVALKVKDALVDKVRESAGARPNVDPTTPQVPVQVHIHGDQAEVFLDLSGDALHRRGYRPAAALAPLKETLAAALLLMAGYTGAQAFCDPMAGSGTLLVEAAWMAMGRAPGLGRHFAFERWPGFAGQAQSQWHRMVHEAGARVRRTQLPVLLGSDWHPKAVAMMEESVHRAGVEGLVRMQRADVRKLEPPHADGILVTNVPYGERLGKDLQLRGLYRGMGEQLKQWPGWAMHVLCGNPMFEPEFARPPARKHSLFNGALRVQLYSYPAREGGGLARAGMQ